MPGEFEREAAIRLQSFRLEPPPEVWEAISAALDKRRRKGVLWWLLPGLLIAGGIIWMIFDRPIPAETRSVRRPGTPVQRAVPSQRPRAHFAQEAAQPGRPFATTQANAASTHVSGIRSAPTPAPAQKIAVARSEAGQPRVDVLRDTPEDRVAQPGFAQQKEASRGGDSAIPPAKQIVSDTSRSDTTVPQKTRSKKASKSQWHLSVSAGLGFAGVAPPATGQSIANITAPPVGSIFTGVTAFQSSPAIYAGPLLGIAVSNERVVGNNWIFSAGLSYTYLSNRLAGRDTSGKSLELTAINHLVSIPLMFRKNLGRSRRTGLFLGVTPGWVIAGEWPVQTSTGSYRLTDSSLRRFNLAFQAGYGMDLNRWRISLTARQDLTPATATAAKYRNAVFLSVGAPLQFRKTNKH